MERGGDCECCFCLSQDGADAILDCGLRRWPEVGIWEVPLQVAGELSAVGPTPSKRRLAPLGLGRCVRAATTPVAAPDLNGASGGVKGEKPTDFGTDCLLTVSDSYSALQRFQSVPTLCKLLYSSFGAFSIPVSHPNVSISA
jgi:hypothetical protein